MVRQVSEPGFKKGLEDDAPMSFGSNDQEERKSRPYSRRSEVMM